MTQAEHENPYLGKGFTLSEAKRIQGHFVYGLTDEKNELFYVGKTTDAYRRFHDHKRKMQNPHFLRRLREAGEHLRVVIINYRPVDLEAAEAAAIIANSQTLTNLRHNPYKTREGIRVPVDARHDVMGQCPGCDNPLDKPRYKYCSACVQKHLVKSQSAKQAANDLSILATAHRRQ